MLTIRPEKSTRIYGGKMREGLFEELAIVFIAAGSLLISCTSQSEPIASNTILPSEPSLAITSIIATDPISTTIAPITQTQSLTLTLTPVPTTTYIPYPSSTPLSMLLLSEEDVQTAVNQEAIFSGGMYSFFIDNEGRPLYIVDRSYDLQSSCAIECTRQIWLNSPNSVIITMIRSQDAQAAKLVAEELYFKRQPFDHEYGEYEFNWVNAPTENTHIGISNWNGKYVLTTSVGPIAIMVELSIPQIDDAPIDVLVGFAVFQINNLREANIVP